MMQAIGALERSIDRLEKDIALRAELGRVEAARAEPPRDPQPPPRFDDAAARAALRSLDDLMESLKGRADG